MVHSNGFVSSNETLKEGYKSTKQSKIASNKNCNKYINSHSKSSQLKENDSKISKRNGQSMSFKMNISGLPFISGKVCIVFCITLKYILDEKNISLKIIQFCICIITNLPELSFCLYSSMA